MARTIPCAPAHRVGDTTVELGDQLKMSSFVEITWDHSYDAVTGPGDHTYGALRPEAVLDTDQIEGNYQLIQILSNISQTMTHVTTACHHMLAAVQSRLRVALTQKL